jgi:hypothetical protein
MKKLVGIDVSVLPQSHWDKSQIKGQLLTEARALWESGDRKGRSAYAKVAIMEEDLMQECLQFGVIQKYFIHAFSATHCWIKSGNLYRAEQLCQEIMAQKELSSELAAKGKELMEKIDDELQIFQQRAISRMAA